MNDLFVLVLIDAVAFFTYGFSCLSMPKMKLEFRRFGLQDYQRKITGISQLLGSIGLIVGYYFNSYILLAAAMGLSVLMLAGLIVRIRIKDSLFQSSPAFIFFVWNVVLSYLTIPFLT